MGTSISPRKLLPEKMSWELAVWRRRERMVVEMVMVVVMIVRGGLLLCIQHSIPGTYNLNNKIIIKTKYQIYVFYLNEEKNAFHSDDYIIM